MEMRTLSLFCAACVWMALICPSHGTGFVYHFPGMTVQRQRIKSEQSGSAGPPGTGSLSQLRWAHAHNPNLLFSITATNFHFWPVWFPLWFRNWCQYTVTKTVSCQVHNGTETTVQRVLQGCRWPGPCPKVIRYSSILHFPSKTRAECGSVAFLQGFYYPNGALTLERWGKFDLLKVFPH